MNTKYAIVVAIVAIAIILGSVVAYISLSGPSASSPSITLQGAGATFPYPLLNSMITNYTDKREAERPSKLSTNR